MPQNLYGQPAAPLSQSLRQAIDVHTLLNILQQARTSVVLSDRLREPCVSSQILMVLSQEAVASLPGQASRPLTCDNQ